MRRSCLFAALSCSLVLFGSAALADTTIVSVSRPRDIAYDDAHDVLYISSGNKPVQRYQVGTATFLSPLALDGDLGAMDISPDGSTLALTDYSYKTNQSWIYLVDLSSLAIRKVPFDTSNSEQGTCRLAYDRKGQILISSWSPSLSSPLRLYDPVSGATAVAGTVDACAMVSASANGKAIGIAGGGSAGDGYYGQYNVNSGRLTHEALAGGLMTYEIGVSRDAKLLAVPTYQGTYIADAQLNLTGTVIGQQAGPQPIGAAFHPKRNLVYFPWAQSSEVQVFNTKTWTLVNAYDCKKTFDNEASAMIEGRVKLSRDGSLLFVTMQGGVCYTSTLRH